MTLNQPIALSIPFEMVDRFEESEPCFTRQSFTGPATEFRMRIDSRSHSSSANRKFQDCFQSPLCSPDAQFQLAGKSTEFLAKTQRRGICQVSPADLDDFVPALGLGLQDISEPAESGNQRFVNTDGDGNMNRGGKRVVGALPHVDVVVRMDRLLHFEAISTGGFDRSIRNDLIAIHIAGGSRSGLENINREFAVEPAGNDFLGGVQHRINLLSVEWVLAGAGQFSKIPVRDPAGPFDQTHRLNHFWSQCPTRYRKVLDRSLSLCAIVGLSGNLNITHRIVFGTKFGHRSLPIVFTRN